jgi:hypothetical protein
VTKFVFVSAERGNHAVAMLCRIVGVSVSGFYAWLRAIPAVHDRAELEADLAAILTASSRRGVGFMARPGSTLNCAGKAAGTAGDASSG